MSSKQKKIMTTTIFIEFDSLLVYDIKEKEDIISHYFQQYHELDFKIDFESFKIYKHYDYQINAIEGERMRLAGHLDFMEVDWKCIDVEANNIEIYLKVQ